MAPGAPDGERAIGLASEPEELAGIADEVTGFVADRVASSDRSGVVVEISGGLNSAVATILSVDALGAYDVAGLLLPAYMSTEADALTAELVAEGLEIEFTKVQLLPFVHLFRELSVPEADPPHDVGATANAIDRMRMACAYYVAETTDRLVVGTEDRTQRLLGSTTRYGVRRGDLLPLGDLYHTEVRNLADHLGIPDGVCESPAGSPGSESEPPTGPGVDVDPRTVDAILRRLVDDDEGIVQTAEETGVAREVVRSLAERHAENRHNRVLPPTPATAKANRYDSFHEIELRFD